MYCWVMLGKYPLIQFNCDLADNPSSYCASPISGMGTTLALSGAYNLAGALNRHIEDYTAAFGEYEDKMRPIVDRAQKLPPGAPHIFAPETAWGILVMRIIFGILSWFRLATLVAMLAGPPANAVFIEDYGFDQAPEWNWPTNKMQ